MKWSAIMLAVVAIGATGRAEANPAAHHRAQHHRRLARPNPRHRVFEMAAGSSSVERPYHAAAPVGRETMPTSLQYRLGRSPAIAAIGYNRAGATYEIDPHDVNSAASTQLGHPDATVGAKVSVPF
jgi:hypothetical protein